MKGYQKWLIEQYADQLMIALFVDLYASELGGTASSEVRYNLRMKALRSASTLAMTYNEKYL